MDRPEIGTCPAGHPLVGLGTYCWDCREYASRDPGQRRTPDPVPEGTPEVRTIQNGILTLPLPPSANRYWRHVGSKVLLSGDARAYRAACDEALAGQWKGEPLEGQVSVRADFYMDGRGDLDNRAKQLLDGIKGRAFADDSQVWELHMVRHLDRGRPRVEIQVRRLA
jgi:Holliday junction resolvase RusA-like endonuclease